MSYARYSGMKVQVVTRLDRSLASLATFWVIRAKDNHEGRLEGANERSSEGGNRSMRSEAQESAQTRINPQDSAEMIYIPAGDFLMGDEDEGLYIIQRDYPPWIPSELVGNNNPRHTVRLSGYWIYKNLVTVGIYKGSVRRSECLCRLPRLSIPTGAERIIPLSMFPGRIRWPAVNGLPRQVSR